MATVSEVKDMYSAFERGLMGWPTCARCNKPVDRMEMRQQPWRDGVAITVWCHGATEVIELSGDIFYDANTARFDGQAFVEKPALPATTHRQG